MLNGMHTFAEAPSRSYFHANGIRNFTVTCVLAHTIPLIKMLNRYYAVITCNLIFLLNFLVLLVLIVASKSLSFAADAAGKWENMNFKCPF